MLSISVSFGIAYGYGCDLQVHYMPFSKFADHAYTYAYVPMCFVHMGLCLGICHCLYTFFFLMFSLSLSSLSRRLV